jgi:hypothetical protein
MQYNVLDAANKEHSIGVRIYGKIEDEKAWYIFNGSLEFKNEAVTDPSFVHLAAPLKNYDFPYHLDYTFKEGGDFSQVIYLYEDTFINSYYLGPLREYPHRIYIWGGEEPQNVGVRGENFAAALLSSRARKIGVAERVAQWLKELGLVHSFKVQPIAKGRQEYEVLVKRTADSTEVPITDVGFGVSQILPVLTLCYYVPEGSTIILEQPEIHLHPAVQAGLADVLIDAIKTRNVQIILESHSEHLLRRLQRRIAEEKFSKEDAALYFCEMGKQGASHLKPLELNEYGYITNWPEDFFGDEMEDLVEQSKATTRREQEKKANQQKDVAQSQEAA